MENKLTLDSKVIFINRVDNNFHEKYIHEQTIGGYLDQMSITSRREDVIVAEGFYQDLNESGKIKTILSAIISGLTGLYEYDDLFYTIKDDEVHIDRLQIKEKEV